MKVFVAGATGAVGKQLVPMLVANGHDVVGMTRTQAKRDQVRSLGAQPVVADALDANAVGRAVGEAEPDVQRDLLAVKWPASPACAPRLAVHVPDRRHRSPASPTTPGARR